MSHVTTIIRLPASTRKRVEAAAKHARVTPQAFMLRAIETELRAAERHLRFVDDALQAEKEMQASGALDEARAYFEALAQTRSAIRPRAWPCRKRSRSTLAASA